MQHRMVSEIALEAISHQTDGDVFHRVTAIFEHILQAVKQQRALRKASTLSKIIGDSGLIDFIADPKKIGVQIQIEISTDPNPFAAVIPPALDDNHPFYNRTFRDMRSQSDLRTYLKDHGPIFEGQIDLNTGRVSGTYSELISTVYISAGLFDGRFTSDEVAAIFLHEIGHIVTYMEYLGRTVTLNHVLATGLQHLSGITDRKQRVLICEAMTEKLDLSDEVVPTALAELSDNGALQMYVSSAYGNKEVSATGTPLYDGTTWEAMSDQFVTRHGGGRSLVVGLDKFYRMMTPELYFSYKVRLMQDALGTSAVIFSSMLYPVLGVMVAVMLVLGVQMQRLQSRYDTASDRARRVREDILVLIKSPTADRDVRQRAQTDIKAIDKVMDQYTEYVTLFDRFQKWRLSSRRERKSTQVVQELERLFNNDLYVKANDLSLIAN